MFLLLFVIVVVIVIVVILIVAILIVVIVIVVIPIGVLCRGFGMLNSKTASGHLSHALFGQIIYPAGSSIPEAEFGILEVNCPVLERCQKT